MTVPKQLDAQVLRVPTDFKHWLIASVSLSYDDLVAFLSMPHYTENDPLRTAGGCEHHWAFEFPCGTRIGIVFRVPYCEASIIADPPNKEVVLNYLSPLLTNREVKIVDEPLLIE